MRRGVRTFTLAAAVVAAVAGAAVPSWAGPGWSNGPHGPSWSGRPGGAGGPHGPVWAGPRYGSPSVTVEIIAPTAPPPPRAEVRPRRPGPMFVWVPGYWAWGHGRFAWVSGHWDRPPHHGGVWVEGHWAPRHHQWVWVPGHWR